jgi:AraC-like DNA-binding protein
MQSKPDMSAITRNCFKTCSAQTEEARTGTVSAAYALTLIDVAVHQGVSRTQMLAVAQSAGAILDDPLARVPLAVLEQLFDLVKKLSQNSFIGLDFGAAVRPASFGALGYVTMTCNTLGDAISLIPRYGRLAIDSLHRRAAFQLEGDTLRLEEAVLPGAPPQSRSAIEAVLAGWVSFGRWITDQNLNPLEVRFRHYPEPGQEQAFEAAYHKTFRCAVRFGAADNSLVLPAAYLQLPVRVADPAWHHTLLVQAQHQLDRAFAQLALVRRVHALVTELLPSGELSLGLVAARLRISERTLQRRLSEQGVQFRALIDDMRREGAVRMLADPSVSITDVALRLGFADSSALSHAFRGWYGCAPQQYRHGHGNSATS